MSNRTERKRGRRKTPVRVRPKLIVPAHIVPREVVAPRGFLPLHRIFVLASVVFSMDDRDYVQKRALNGAGFDQDGFSKAEDDEPLPDAAADLDDVEDTPRDIEHEQVYYLLADAYPDKFDNAEDARQQLHSFLDIETEEKEDPCWDGYEQQGMKEGEDGEQVPNCVPKDD